MTTAYTRGRRALSSAEKPENYDEGKGQRLRREMEIYRVTPDQAREKAKEGFYMPDEPSNKAIKYLNRGHTVAVT